MNDKEKCFQDFFMCDLCELSYPSDACDNADCDGRIYPSETEKINDYNARIDGDKIPVSNESQSND
jgi:hypothetical protein